MGELLGQAKLGGRGDGITTACRRGRRGGKASMGSEYRRGPAPKEQEEPGQKARGTPTAMDKLDAQTMEVAPSAVAATTASAITLEPLAKASNSKTPAGLGT